VRIDNLPGMDTAPDYYPSANQRWTEWFFNERIGYQKIF